MAPLDPIAIQKRRKRNKKAAAVDTDAAVRRRMQRRQSKLYRPPKGFTARDAAEEFYIPDELERESIKTKVVKSLPALVDVIDNFNRLFYANTAALYEAARPGSTTMKRMGKAFVRGLKREERRGLREVAEKAFPSKMRKLEKSALGHDFKIFGIDVDAMDVAFFVGELPVDPLVWIPFGLPLKLSKKGLRGAGKAVGLVSRKTLGDAAVDKITRKAMDTWYKKIAPKVNLKSIFGRKYKGPGAEYVQRGTKIFVKDGKTLRQHSVHKTTEHAGKALKGLQANVKEFDLLDALEPYIKNTESAPTMVEKSVRHAATIETKKPGIFRMLFWGRKTANLKQTKQMIDVFRKAEGEAIERFGHYYIKELAMSVEDALRVSRVQKIFDDLAEGGSKISMEQLGIVRAEVNMMKGNAAKHIAHRLAEDRGIRRLANQIGRVEKSAAIEMARQRWKMLSTVTGDFAAGNARELGLLGKALKSNMKMVRQLMGEDLSQTKQIMKGLDEDLARFIKEDASPKAFTQVKARLDELKGRVQNLRKYQIETRKGLKKLKGKRAAQKKVRKIKESGGELFEGATGKRLESLKGAEMTIGKIDNMISRLEQSFASRTGQGIGGARKLLLGEVNTIMRDIGKQLGVFKKTRLQQFERVEGAVKLGGKVQEELVGEFSERAGKLMGENAKLMRYMKAEAVKLKDLERRADAFMKVQVKDWERSFRGFRSGSSYLKAMERFGKDRHVIMKKWIRTLPEELQGPAWKARTILDEMKVKMSEGGIGVNELLYTPRGITKETQEMISKSLNIDQSKLGFMKKRKFRQFEEMNEYIKGQGGKVEDDLFAMIFHNYLNQEAHLAKKTMMESIIAKFGGAKNVPIEVKKAMRQLYKPRPYIPVYTPALNVIKFMLTAPNPAFQGRNILGFPFLAATTAGFRSGLNLRNYTDAFALKFGRKGEGAIATKIGDISHDMIRKMVDADGYIAASFTRSNITKGANFALNRGSYQYNPLMKFAARLHEVSMNIEDIGRYGAFLANLRAGKFLKKGQKMGQRQYIEAALKDARTAMFDYNLWSSPADKMLDSVFGFYTFPRRNMPRQFMNVMQDPKQYSIVSRAINKVSNREELTEEEMAVMNSYDKETLNIFGKSINGVRQFISIGFHPMEEAYRTLNSLYQDDWRKTFGGRVNPLLGSFLDYWYSQDSFRGTDMGTALPAKYTAVIPKVVQKAFKLTEREVPKWRGGVEVGTEKKLYGSPNSVFFFRRFPIWSRQINDIATALDLSKSGKGTQAVLRGLAGVRTSEWKPDQWKKWRKQIQDRAITEEMKARGAKRFESVYTPRHTKKSKAYKEALKRLSDKK